MITLRIKEICKQQGTTLNALAERIGVSQPSISGIATGRQKPSLDTIEKIASALNVPVSELFAAPAEGVITCPHCGKSITLKAE
ncbi:helix-turn-helix transcriptional regulator [Paramuribaculum intestinale]|uniref:helix-turn-helix domain-containing protein n=1 Tax=Paramuribaculum intestinale TaxID=2094151 RepID=UPI0025A9D22C|nr:helix-turn-helix transcriptional regulator [Paramuribaculum intestinale]